jgi:ATP-dependent exoDNAse (exonuclease V) beta subunit
MIVGDPKQSIYRWREKEQFIELSKDKTRSVILIKDSNI